MPARRWSGCGRVVLTWRDVAFVILYSLSYTKDRGASSVAYLVGHALADVEYETRSADLERLRAVAAPSGRDV